MIRKELWEEIGGFDERYAPAYCEDSDLAFEVRTHGKRGVYQPKSVVIHFEGISNGTDVQGTGLKRYQTVNTEKFREKCRQEKAELATVQEALGREFPQKAELALARENNSAVIRELQRMQDDASYVSTWTPKTSLADGQPAATEAPQRMGTDNTAAPPAEPPEKQFHTLKYGEGEGRSEYTVSNQHNGHTLENGYILRRTYFNSVVGSLGQSLYDDGLWHSTATVPRDVTLRMFASLE